MFLPFLGRIIPIDKFTVELIWRDIVYHKNTQKNTSQNRTRGLEFEDLPASVTRQMNWDEAFGFCDNLTLNGETDWRLPGILELQETWYRNRSGSGSFTYSSFEDYYWTSNGNASGTAYSTVKGDGSSTELSTFGAILKGLSRNVRCVRDTSNVCEIEPL